MKVDRTRPDGAPAGQRDPRPPETSHQGPQEKDRRPHGFDQIIGSLTVPDLPGVYRQDAVLFLEKDAHSRHDELDGPGIFELGYILEVVPAFRQDAGRHHGECRVLGATDFHRASEAFTSLNEDLVHSSDLTSSGDLKDFDWDLPAKRVKVGVTGQATLAQSRRGRQIICRRMKSALADFMGECRGGKVCRGCHVGEFG